MLGEGGNGLAVALAPGPRPGVLDLDRTPGSDLESREQRAESMDDTEWVIIASYENAPGRPVPLAAVRA